MKTSRFAKSQVAAILQDGEAGAAQPIDLHGRPWAIRCDTGPEPISETITAWCRSQDIEERFSQPGKPDKSHISKDLTHLLEALARGRNSSSELTIRRGSFGT